MCPNPAVSFGLCLTHRKQAMTIHDNETQPELYTLLVTAEEKQIIQTALTGLQVDYQETLRMRLPSEMTASIEERIANVRELRARLFK